MEKFRELFEGYSISKADMKKAQTGKDVKVGFACTKDIDAALEKNGWKYSSNSTNSRDGTINVSGQWNGSLLEYNMDPYNGTVELFGEDGEDDL